MERIEEGLRSLFKELHGDETVDIADFKDVNAGWEARIYGFRLIQGENVEEMVARVFSGSSAGERADREFHVMSRLLRAGYPVPDVYICDTGTDLIGAPFIIMEKLTGGSLMDDFLSADPEKRRENLALFSRLYAELHILPRKTLPFSRNYRGTRGRLEYRIRGIEESLSDSGITYLQDIVSWLDSRKKKVTNEPLVVIHQDFHPGNILFKMDGSPVVIDWSGADIGDPREDLAWTKLLATTFYSPELGDAFVSGYASASDREFADLDYFEVIEILRRLRDMVISLSGGAASMGMRGEVEELMKRNRSHYLNILKRLKVLTGLEVPEVTKLFT
jgi:aminoglycoside phosphotransferase (APT) family kinase protein